MECSAFFGFKGARVRNVGKSNQMILLRLAELIIIYTTIISFTFVQSTTSTNYWPQIKSQYLINHQRRQQQQQQLEQQQLVLLSASSNPFPSTASSSISSKAGQTDQQQQQQDDGSIRTALVAPANVGSLTDLMSSSNNNAEDRALAVSLQPKLTNSQEQSNYHFHHQNSAQQQQLQLQLHLQLQQLQNHHLQNQKNQPIDTKKRQLLIGQHYNNFSSIVPYSIVQDSDYNSPADQLLEEEEERQQQQQRQYFQQDHQKLKINPNDDFNKHQNNNHLIIADSSNESSRSDSSMAGGGNLGYESDNKAFGKHNSKANSRALLPLDSNRLILPQMQQIKSRFNQGCVGGTKCQFFAFCWMSGGSLGASCGLLMTCCVTPSRQEIQPGFYGPVVNDPCK